MVDCSSHDFDIDVDLSEVLGDVSGASLVNGRLYDLVSPHPARQPKLQKKLEQTLRNATLRAQWLASRRRKLDRRRAIRVPLLTRVHVKDGASLTACDISLSGLRCSGQPVSPVMDISFKLPNQHIPIETRVEVISYKDSVVIPLIALRFIWIDRPYLEQIATYVAKQREKYFPAKAA